VKTLALSAIFCSSLMYAGPIAITEIGGFVHGNGGLIAQLDPASSGYFATLDGNNLGTFGWTFANTSGAVITDASVLVFLDADIDETTNTFFNEYGQFVSLVLPPGAPSGATAASSWEIDEPGFLFGDIYDNLLAGLLDNTNNVPSSRPEDVSLALGFALGSLGVGETATITALISLSSIGGLSHSDPATPYTFYFNGYATTSDLPSEVPEPGSFGPVFLTLAALIALTGTRTGR